MPGSVSAARLFTTSLPISYPHLRAQGGSVKVLRTFRREEGKRLRTTGNWLIGKDPISPDVLKFSAPLAPP